MDLGSVRRSTWRSAMVLLVLYLLVGSMLVGLPSISYGHLLFVLGVVFISGLIVARVRADTTDSDSVWNAITDSDSVWNAIPSWQYDGRHAESGGLTRGEQEQALQEITDEAEQRHNESHQKR